MSQHDALSFSLNDNKSKYAEVYNDDKNLFYSHWIDRQWVNQSLYHIRKHNHGVLQSHVTFYINLCDEQLAPRPLCFGNYLCKNKSRLIYVEYYLLRWLDSYYLFKCIMLCSISISWYSVKNRTYPRMTLADWIAWFSKWHFTM